MKDEIPMPEEFLGFKVHSRHHAGEVKFVEYLLSRLKPRKGHELIDSLIVFDKCNGARSYRNTPASVLIHTANGFDECVFVLEVKIIVTDSAVGEEAGNRATCQKTILDCAPTLNERFNLSAEIFHDILRLADGRTF